MVRAGKGIASAGGSAFARLLGMRCPNCGAHTASTILWRCGECGYPSRRRIRCPGCGQPTARTRDWACQWCGYPLASSLYKEAASSPWVTAANATGSVNEVKPVKTPEPPATVPAHGPVLTVGAPVPPAMVDPATTTAQAAVGVPANVAAMPPAEPEPASETTAPYKAPSPQVSLEVLATTIEDLDKDFRTDAVLADAKYRGRMLKVKGVVTEASAGDGGGAPTLVLGSSDPGVTRRVQCAFDSGHAALVGRLSVGQRVAILGRYEGGEDGIRLADCLPVG